MQIGLKALSNPILLIGDGPSEPTGLARIGRDLAWLLSSMPEFRVGYLARGGFARRNFPWVQYNYPERTGGWGEQYVMEAYKDLAGTDAGIIMSTWDLSRQLYFSQHQGLSEDLARFLGPGRNYAKWAYVPVDATGPDEQGLPIGMVEAARGYERVCAASEWGAQVIRRHRPSNWIPHGLDLAKFTIGPRRGTLDWPDDQITVGCVMANQSRKDWPVAFECAKILKADMGNRFKMWCHTDVMIGYWNLYALATDYGVGDSIEVTLDLTDEQLAQRYSACEATILPTGGEGFGYPIVESMACGTSCITTDYAAGQELVDDDCKVGPVAYRVDTQHDVRRAVLSGWGFASRAKAQIERKQEDWDYRGQELRAKVEHLDWENLGHVWRRWFREGIGL